MSSKARLEKVIAVVSDVRRSAGRRVLRLVMGLFALVLASYLLEPPEPIIRDSLGAELKSYAARLQAMVLVGCITLYGWLSGRAGRASILRSKVQELVGSHESRVQLEQQTRLEAQRLAEEAERVRDVDDDAERRRFEAVLRQVPVERSSVRATRGAMVLPKDRLGEISSTHDRAMRTSAWTHENGASRDGDEAPVMRCPRIGEACADESVPYVRAHGLRRLTLGSAPALDGQKSAIAAIGACANVVERDAAQQEGERLIDALQTSNATLERFAFVAAHDLKAPLRGIRNLSSWIQEDLGDCGSDRVHEHLALLRDRVARMSALVDGILRYARSGGRDATVEDVSLAALVGETIDLLHPAKGVRVDVDAASIDVRTAKVSLQQVLLNLVGNAIEHADRDDAHIVIICARESDSLRLSIRDNGPGIPAEAQSRVWEILCSGAKAKTADRKGIGLAVVKRILDVRGGRAWVESNVGEGATFHVHWPL